MLAPAHHPAMRNVAPVRTELGTRTMFNLLGPLSNPAGVKRLLLGVFSASWLEPVAETLRDLGTERAWVVHGSDGLDEMTTTGPTHVVELDAGKIRRFEVVPEEAGIARAAPEALKAASPRRMRRPCVMCWMASRGRIAISPFSTRRVRSWLRARLRA